MAEQKLKIVGIGAHMDDCWLGFGATALKALRKGHSVTFVTAVTEYRKLWYISGRGDEIAAFHAKQTKDTGVKHIGMKKDYMRLVNTPELIDEVSQILMAEQPDILFVHDENEGNQDHTALGAASRIASQHAGCFVPHEKQPIKLPGEIYQYTTGWQSRGFFPDMHVDVSETIYDALRISSSYDILYANGRWPTTVLKITDPLRDNETLELTGHSRFKFGQSITGTPGGYTEAFKAYNPMGLQYRRLATI